MGSDRPGSPADARRRARRAGPARPAPGPDVARHAASAPVQRDRHSRSTLPLLAVLVAVAFAGWSTGWNFLAPVAALPVTAVLVHREHGGIWRLAAAVTGALTVLGQVLVATGHQDTVVGTTASHLATLVTLTLSLGAIAVIGRAAIEREEGRRALARSEARLTALLSTTGDILVVTDAAGLLTFVSPAAEKALGRPDHLVGTALLDTVDHEHREGVERRLRAVVAEGPGAEVTMDVLVMHSSGERRWYEWRVVNLLGDPLVQGLVVDQRDVTERLLHSEALAYAAAHDDLTGLANRTELLRLLCALLPEATPGAGVALLYLDLDRFKEVNDTHGHAAGDELLVVVARRLQAGLRHHDHLARLGGDEFGAILTEVHDEDEVLAVVERLRRSVSEPVALSGGHRVTVDVSIGSVLTTDADRDPGALFAAADAAMYEAKRTGRPGPPHA